MPFRFVAAVCGRPEMNLQDGPKTEPDPFMVKIRLPWRQLPLLPLPRFLSGFRLGDWWRLLREHRFGIDPIFWPRAVLATLGAAVTSCLAHLEERVTPDYGDADLLERPIFILGLPRSGTLHLFGLLSQGPDFCYPTRFDVFNHHTFLLLRRTFRRLGSSLPSTLLDPSQKWLGRKLGKVVRSLCGPERSHEVASALERLVWRFPANSIDSMPEK